MHSSTVFSQADLEHLIAGTHWNPRASLGPHRGAIDGQSCLIIRAWFPYAARADVLPADPTESLAPMTRLHVNDPSATAATGNLPTVCATTSHTR